MSELLTHFKTRDATAFKNKIQSGVNKDIGRYTASLAFSRVQQEDVDYRTEHTLRVTNRAGSAEFIVKLDTSRRCQCDRNTGAGQ